VGVTVLLGIVALEGIVKLERKREYFGVRKYEK
jgi:hypothetical protein